MSPEQQIEHDKGAPKSEEKPEDFVGDENKAREIVEAEKYFRNCIIEAKEDVAKIVADYT